MSGRQIDIGAFDSPKNPGQPLGWVQQLAKDHVVLVCDDPTTVVNNGDGLCYYDLHHNLLGLAINRAEATAQPGVWQLFPKDPMHTHVDLKKGLTLNRNRDMSWVRTLDKPSAERRIRVQAVLKESSEATVRHGQQGLELRLTDESGFEGHARIELPWQAPKDAEQAKARMAKQLGKLGETDFELCELSISLDRDWFVPDSLLNALRRDAVSDLVAQRRQGLLPLPRGQAVEPPVPYPEPALSYLANVYNQKAHDFYQRHGVEVIDAAYESHEETEEVSLMITKHRVRFSLSLCPKQAKGVTGVQGTVRAEPLQLINGKEKLTLRFDCKPCEMHVVGRIKNAVLSAAIEQPLTFYRTRPQPSLS